VVGEKTTLKRMANKSSSFLLNYPYYHRVPEDHYFTFFGCKFDNIESISEAVSPETLCRCFHWQTRTGEVHKYKFQQEGNHMDDINALMVMLRMS